MSQATQAWRHWRHHAAMRFLMTGLLLAVSCVPVLPHAAKAQGGTLSLLLLACQRGNVSACHAALPIIGNACQRGQQQACSLHTSIRARRQAGQFTEATSDRALQQRCFSGEASACKRLQEGPQRGSKAEQQLDIPGLGR